MFYLHYTPIGRDEKPQARQLDPRYTEAYYNRGLAFQSVAQMKQAEMDFKQVITLDNNPQLKTLAQKRLEQL